MKLILTASIKEVEFEPLIKTFPLESVKIAAKKALQGLGDNIKKLNKNSQDSFKENIFNEHGRSRASCLYYKSPLKNQFW